MNIDYITLGVLLIGFITTSLIATINILIPRITHTFVARKTQNRSGKVAIHHMFETTHKDGSVWWKSFPLAKIKIPAPPDEVVDNNEHGKKVAEGYLVSTDEVVWIKDSGLSKNEKVLDSFKPFSTTQRAVLVQELETAHMKRGNKFLTPEFVMPMTAMLVLGMFGVCFLIFGSELINPLLQMADKNIAYQQKNIELAEMNARISQSLGVKMGLDLTSIPQTAVPSSDVSTINQPENTNFR